MRKIKLILFLFIILIDCTFGETVQTDFVLDTTPTSLDQIIYIQGINEKNGIISYIKRFLSPSNQDYKYSYIVYDYKNNIELEIPNKLWIGRYYNEFAIYNWEDKKYSLDAYKKIIEDTLNQSYEKYNLIDFNQKKERLAECKVVLKCRKPQSTLVEDISYELKFTYNNKNYCYNENLIKTNTIKSISEITAYSAGGYIIIIQKIARKNFEDDDYYDYVIRGIKK